jgi:hypothetical protein
MKAWLILGGMALVTVALVLWIRLGPDNVADREFENSTKEKPVIEKALAECGDLVRYFAERKWTERKKSELDDLRRRFESLERSANELVADKQADRAARTKRFAEIEEAFYKLRTDATDLRARLTEMKKFDETLRPAMARLGRLKKELADATAVSTDPEFQQRASTLLTESRTDQSLGELALEKLSVKILDGRVMAQTALNEIGDLSKRMEELLTKHAGAPARDGK